MPKIKKEKNTFVAHFHKVFRPRPLTPFELRPKFWAKWKTSSIYITQISFLKTTVLVLILETFKS